MAILDFIENSTTGYHFVWSNRKYLLLCLIPVIFVRVLCVLIIFLINTEASPLREGILLMPANVLEAVFLVMLIRFYIFQEPIYIWGKYLPAPIINTQSVQRPLNYLRSNKISLQAGVASYLLVKVLLGALIGVLAIRSQTDFSNLQEPSIGKAILSMFLLAGMFWSIRLAWLYVPLAAGMKASIFLQKIKGIGNSLYFIGIIIICTFPLLLLYSFIANFVDSFIGAKSGVAIIINSFLQSFFVLTILSIQTIAAAKGVHDLLFNKSKS